MTAPMSLGERAAYALIGDEFFSIGIPVYGLKKIIDSMETLDKNQLMISTTRIYEHLAIGDMVHDSETLKAERFKNSDGKRFSLKIDGREIPFASTQKRRFFGYKTYIEILPCMISQAEDALVHIFRSCMVLGKTKQVRSVQSNGNCPD